MGMMVSLRGLECFSRKERAREQLPSPTTSAAEQTWKPPRSPKLLQVERSIFQHWTEFSLCIAVTLGRHDGMAVTFRLSISSLLS